MADRRRVWHSEGDSGGGGISVMADWIDREVDVLVAGAGPTGLALACEPIPGFLMAMVDDGGLLPHLKKRLAQPQEHEKETQ